MSNPVKKKTSVKPTATRPDQSKQGQMTRTRKIATVIVSVVLVISLGLPVAGLGFASCSSCSFPLYD
ncbi:MAG: hypothetical protein LBU61_05830 [Coriobacteriales bacterium]|jgi:hypothetical protein|nr:hypothetical protein [Coriobacteriales bacterium]